MQNPRAVSRLMERCGFAEGLAGQDPFRFDGLFPKFQRGVSIFGFRQSFPVELKKGPYFLRGGTLARPLHSVSALLEGGIPLTIRKIQ